MQQPDDPDAIVSIPIFKGEPVRIHERNEIVHDKAGRPWEIGHYNSPSGPAFCITLPPEFDPPGTYGYTIHFPGMVVFNATA